MRTDEILDDVLRREGSAYTFYAADRGGQTKHGITLRTLEAFRGRRCLPSELELLTEVEARAIYRRQYIEAPGFSAIADEQLRALVIDFGVHSGQARATKALQQALGVDPDGVFGPATRAALERAELTTVYRALLTARFLFLADVVARDASQRVFLRGWIARCCEFLP